MAFSALIDPWRYKSTGHEYIFIFSSLGGKSEQTEIMSFSLKKNPSVRWSTAQSLLYDLFLTSNGILFVTFTWFPKRSKHSIANQFGLKVVFSDILWYAVTTQLADIIKQDPDGSLFSSQRMKIEPPSLK